MPDAPTTPGYSGLTRTLCLVVLAVMLVSVLYAAWIAISNFTRIGV